MYGVGEEAEVKIRVVTKALKRAAEETELREIECLISLILSYKVSKKTALLSCTANQAGIDHKLHFHPNNPARTKLAAINNKNGCGTAEL